MGADSSKSSFKCFNSKDIKPVPKYHFKCRFDLNDQYKNTGPLFTRTKDIYV